MLNFHRTKSIYYKLSRKVMYIINKTNWSPLKKKRFKKDKSSTLLLVNIIRRLKSQATLTNDDQLHLGHLGGLGGHPALVQGGVFGLQVGEAQAVVLCPLLVQDGHSFVVGIPGHRNFFETTL